MDKINSVYKQMRCEEQALLSDLNLIDKKLEEIGDTQKTIVVKNIQGKQYYYEQWNENGRTVSRSLGRVVPGAIAGVEEEIEMRKRLMERKKEQTFLLEQLRKSLKAFEKAKREEPILESYSFEVYWKEELTARVHVHMDKVKVSRYSKHCFKQLFAGDQMTRYQLNKILSMRCFEKGRPDAQEKLKALGLSEYNPYEIVRRTHGVSFNDYIWFRFPKEQLRAADVLVRR